MASQDGARDRKVLRVDDETETVRGTPPNTREQVTAQNPAVAERHPTNPRADKHAASYQRMQEVRTETQQEITELAAAARDMGSSPVQQEYQPQLPQQPQRVEEPLQHDLSLLALTGKVTDEIIVKGFKFSVRTLTARENNEVLREVSQIKDDLEKLGCLRIAILARAIESVNGVPLEQLPGTDQQMKDIVQRKEKFLGDLQLAMLVRLFDKYTSMLERSENLFSALTEEEPLKN